MAEIQWFGAADDSARPRTGLEKWAMIAGGALAILLSLAIIYVIAIALLDEGTMRLGAITFGVVITLLTSPLVSIRKDASPTARKLFWLIDIALLIGFAVSCYWFYVTRERLWEGVFEGTPMDLATAGIGLLVILELTRRAWGLPLVIIALVGIVYGLFGNHAPSFIQHGGIDIDEFTRTIWFSFDGVFGRATGIVASVVLVFLIFGAMLESTGAGESLIRLSTAITARIRGGAAHAAIVASAVFGTMSGSVAANIAGTGVFTIPMIKRQGFSASFAGAVEAAASSGGQLTPPVMAAAAFVMADMVGKPYLLIIAAAALPALFKYLSLFAQVYTEAVRVGIKPLPPEERPKLNRGDIRNALLIFLPIACLMGTFFFGRSAAFAGLVGLLSALVVGLLLNPEFRRKPSKILDALRIGGINSGRIMVAVAVIGIIMGVLNETGIAIKFATEI